MQCGYCGGPIVFVSPRFRGFCCLQHQEKSALLDQVGTTQPEGFVQSSPVARDRRIAPLGPSPAQWQADVTPLNADQAVPPPAVSSCGFQCEIAPADRPATTMAVSHRPFRASLHALPVLRCFRAEHRMPLIPPALWKPKPGWDLAVRPLGKSAEPTDWDLPAPHEPASDAPVLRRTHPRQISAPPFAAWKAVPVTGICPPPVPGPIHFHPQGWRASSLATPAIPLPLWPDPAGAAPVEFLFRDQVVAPFLPLLGIELPAPAPRLPRFLDLPLQTFEPRRAGECLPQLDCLPPPVFPVPDVLTAGDAARLSKAVRPDKVVVMRPRGGRCPVESEPAALVFRALRPEPLPLGAPKLPAPDPCGLSSGVHV